MERCSGRPCCRSSAAPRRPPLPNGPPKAKARNRSHRSSQARPQIDPNVFTPARRSDPEGVCRCTASPPLPSIRDDSISPRSAAREATPPLKTRTYDAVLATGAQRPKFDPTSAKTWPQIGPTSTPHRPHFDPNAAAAIPWTAALPVALVAPNVFRTSTLPDFGPLQPTP